MISYRLLRHILRLFLFRSFMVFMVSFGICFAQQVDQVDNVSLEHLLPTQTSVGLAAVADMRANYARRAASENKDLQTYLLEKMRSSPVRGVRDPDGNVRLTDGHHRLRVLQDLYIAEAQRRGDDLRFPSVPVRIDGDYVGQSWKSFAHHMISSNNVYFDRRIRQEVRQGLRDNTLNIESIFRGNRFIPAGVSALPDNPLRSAIGNVLYDLHISSELFANYLEFHLGDMLEGLNVEPGQENTPEVKQRLRAALFENPEILRHLRCNARPDKWDEAQTAIDNALATHRPFLRESCGRNDLFSALGADDDEGLREANPTSVASIIKIMTDIPVWVTPEYSKCLEGASLR